MKKIVRNFSILFLFISCSMEREGYSSKQEDSENIFLGLHRVRYTFDNENNDIIYRVWIFSDNIFYILYPYSKTDVGYEEPTHYFREGNQLYSCGINTSTMRAESLVDCKNGNPPAYEIIQVDTIESNYAKEQIISLKRGPQNIRLTKNL